MDESKEGESSGVSAHVGVKSFKDMVVGIENQKLADGDMEDEMIDLNGITVEEHTNEKY